MSTKAERLTARIARSKAQIAQHLSALQAIHKQQDLRAAPPRRHTFTNKWRFQVGSLADEAGLRAWSPQDLAAIFQALACFGDVSKALAALKVQLDGLDGAHPETVPNPYLTLVAKGDLPYAQVQFPSAYDAPELGKGVYVLQMQGHPWLKIGSSSALGQRIRSLQIGCPQPLVLHRLYPCERPEEYEHGMHLRLAAYRRTGEWFETDIETIDSAMWDLSPSVWENAYVEFAQDTQFPLTALPRFSENG